MESKIIVVNFKNYVYGGKTLDIIRKIDIYCNKAIVAISFVDIREIAKNTTIPIYAQHVDHFEQGRATGFMTAEAIKDAGAKGSLLNHSEHPISIIKIKKTIDRCNENGLKLIICVSSLEQAQKIKILNPYALAFEDPKLIASGKSITSYRTHDVKKFVELLDKSNILALCGAGVNSADDVKHALELGCEGVLVSSAVANSQDPDNFLKDVSKLL